MAFLDLIRSVGQRIARRATDSAGTAVYARQLLRGNRGPHAATEAPDPPRRGDAELTRATPVPVLLLQGYLANRGSVHLLARRLHERGHVVMTYKLGRMNLGDIRDTAGLVARKVETLAIQTGVERVDIVGHSMGGLVGLYYVKRLGGRHRVRRLILLGTPAAGTWSAAFGLVTAPLGRASRQLLPGSSFLRELHDAPLPAGVELFTLGGERDFFAPIRSVALEGAHHATLPTTHAGLLVEEAVADALDGILRASGTEGAVAAAAAQATGR